MDHRSAIGLDKQAADPAKEIPFSGVFRFANGKLTAVIKDLANPNGIGFSPDGKTLYVSNSGPKMFVNRYPVRQDETLGNPSVLISYPDTPNNEVPDGLKLDSAGNIWTTGPGGIRVITPGLRRNTRRSNTTIRRASCHWVTPPACFWR